jgi:hypothetical protein
MTSNIPLLSKSPRGQVPGLTGLRFVAAFAVLIAHSPDYILPLSKSNFGWIYWVQQGANLGMVLFFVLSGFVIHYNYRVAVTQGGIRGIGGFIWARFARLYPLYIFVLMLDLLLGSRLFQLMAGNVDAFADELRALPYYVTLTQSWRYVSFGDSTLFSAVSSPLSLSWSVSTEWFFYLAYPFIAFFVLRARKPVTTTAALVMWSAIWALFVIIVARAAPRIDTWAVQRYGEIAGQAGQDGFYWWMMYISPYFRIGEFILGCLVSQLYIQLREKPPSRRENRAAWLLLGIGLATIPVLTYIMYVPNARLGYLINIRSLNHNFGYAPSVALLIFCAARYDTLFSRVLNWKPFVLLGEASYSVYLIHFFVFVVVSSAASGALPLTFPTIVFASAKYLYVIALVLLLSLGLHQFIEVPARRWLRGLLGKGPVIRRVFFFSLLASPISIAVALAFVASRATAPIGKGISVVSATYGGNCGALFGNVTHPLRKSCDGKLYCDYAVKVEILGDPAPGCEKNFAIEYECVAHNTRLTKFIGGEAGLGSYLDLSCRSDGQGAN